MNNFEQNWGSFSTHRNEAKQPYRSDAVDLIANLYRHDCKCADWLCDLANLYSQSAGIENEFLKGCRDQQSLVFWIRSLFSKIQEYANQFNREIGGIGLSDYLYIESCAPEFHSVACQEKNHDIWFRASLLFFEGHFANHYQALLIRGNECEIQAFIVPASVRLGLSTNMISSDDFPPFATLKILSNKKLVVTLLLDHEQTQDVLVETSSIPLLARLLFSRFIESSTDRSRYQ